MSYTQITQGQRYQMEALLKTGHNQTKIAAVLSIHKLTVSRELRRNQGLRGYRGVTVQNKLTCKLCRDATINQKLSSP